MNRDERLEIFHALEKTLTYKRYIHTMGVAYTACSLGMRYGESVADCELAGLLHDCAKCCSLGEMQNLCKSQKEAVRPEEKNSKALLHSKAGAAAARAKYGVKNAEILDAIRYHTTGRPDMTLLEKIIFVADYIEPGRDQAPHLDELRTLAFADLDRAVLEILGSTLAFLKEKKEKIDPLTEETYNFYKRICSEKG